MRTIINDNFSEKTREEISNDIDWIMNRLDLDRIPEDYRAGFGFILRYLADIPAPYKVILFFTYLQNPKEGCVRGSRKLNITKAMYIKKRKMVNLYMKYMKYYYDNKDAIDIVLKDKLKTEPYASGYGKKDLNYALFKSFIVNPFESADYFSTKFNLKGKYPSTVYTIYRRCRNILKNEELIKPFLKNIDKIIFGRYKKNENG